MACTCFVKSGDTVMIYVGPFYIDDRSCVLSALTTILRLNGVPYPNLTEDWLQSSTVIGHVIYLDKNNNVLTPPFGDPTIVDRVVYEAWVCVTIDYNEAFGESPTGLVWTLRSRILFEDCDLGIVECVYDLEENLPCQSSITESVLYALTANSAANQMSLFRFPIGVPQAEWSKHHWHQLIDFANDGGVPDNDATDIKGLRAVAGDNGYLVLEDEGAPSGTTRFLSISPRGKTIQNLFTFNSLNYPQHWAYDIIQGANPRVAYIERQTAASNDIALIVCDMNGGNRVEAWYPGDDTAPFYDVCYNTVDGFLYFADSLERIHKVKPDGTGHVELFSLTATGGNFKMSTFVPGYGTGGGIIMYCNPDSSQGWHVFDCAAVTFADVAQQFTSDDHQTYWPANNQSITVGGAITGNPPRNDVKVHNLDGTNVTSLPDIPSVHSAEGFAVIPLSAPFQQAEVLAGFGLRFCPSSEDFVEGVQEVYKDNSATMQSGIGEEIAVAVDQGVLRDHRWINTTAGLRPLLQIESGLRFAQPDGVDNFLQATVDTSVYFQPDQVSAYFVMRHDGWTSGNGCVFFAYEPTGTIRFIFALDGTTDELFMWFGSNVGDGDILRVAVPTGWADNVHIVGLHLDPATDTLYIIVDGVTLGSKVRVNGANLSLGGGSTLYLFRSGSGNYAPVSLWDFIPYAYYQTDVTKAIVRSHLTDRYSALGL